MSVPAKLLPVNALKANIWTRTFRVPFPERIAVIKAESLLCPDGDAAARAGVFKRSKKSERVVHFS